MPVSLIPYGQDNPSEVFIRPGLQDEQTGEFILLSQEPTNNLIKVYRGQLPGLIQMLQKVHQYPDHYFKKDEPP